MQHVKKSVTCDRFSLGTSVSFTNKSDRHDIAEILLKVALNIIILTPLSSRVFVQNVTITYVIN
jgi:hypothetical protein